MSVCHYCGEKYEATTDLERSYLEDEDEYNVCSACLFDVIANDAELQPLPRFREEEVDR